MNPIKKNESRWNDEIGSGLVDQRTGIIQSVTELPELPGEPRFFQYAANLPQLKRILPIKHPPILAGGASLDKHEAETRAVGEAVERYCGSFYFDDEITFGTYEELSDKAMAPTYFPTCSEREYRNSKNYVSRPRKDTRLGWVPALSYLSQRCVLIPAGYVYLTYEPKSREEVITLPISTGLASGRNPQEAIMGGICEAIERDATMIMWMNRLPVPRIDLSTIEHEEIVERIHKIKDAGIKPYLFDMTTDIAIPSVFLTLFSTSGVGPAVTVAAAVHPDPVKACAKALDEGIATRRYCVVRLSQGIKKPDLRDFSKIRTLQDHLILYAYPEMTFAFDFMLKSKRSVKLSDMHSLYTGSPKTSLKSILKMLRELSLEVLVTDLTREDVKQEGFNVTRVVIPELQPLSSDHNIRFLGGRRLYEVPRKIGYAPHRTKEESINHFPHPFA